ncbi:MAG: leucine-rich repeat protein [Lachnospiraceae bacterium]|nr:leucine-rich repeat protein [Lachnospiraceae bacterium]
MDKINFKQLLQEHPECVSNGAKIKAFLKDLYPDVPKAIVNTLTIMAGDGIISEMQKAGQPPLVSARLQKKLEDDYGLSQKIISECFSLIIYDSAKQPQTTNNARSHENINVSAHTTSKSASKKENFPQNTTKSGKKPLSQSIPAKGKTTKQTNTNFAFDPKDFEIENGTLKKYKGSSSVVVIPNSVTSVGDFAFFCCIRLTSIAIPNRVTGIGRSAFYGCNGLTSVTVGNSVTSIGWYAFKGCRGLTSITTPNSVTSIGNSAFSGCTGLTNVTIGNSVTSIGYQAFYGCTELTSIIVDEGNSKYHSAGNCLMETATKTLILGCKTSVIPTDGSVTSIGDNAFEGCTGLTSVTIPASVTHIGEFAFSGCGALTSITVPDSVTSIGKRAFVGCKGLTSITYKGTMTQWKAISKDIDWNKDVPSSCTIYCADGFCH